MADKTLTCGDAGGVKADGTPCGSVLGIQESGLCRVHDPECAQEVQEMRQAGGRASAKKKQEARAAEPEGCPPAPSTLEDATNFASWITRAVAVGVLHPRVGHEASFALRGFMSLLEKRDLLREIAALRAELKEAQRPRPRVA